MHASLIECALTFLHDQLPVYPLTEFMNLKLFNVRSLTKSQNINSVRPVIMKCSLEDR